jgi:site-specific DNA-methyltransferase (adenine-specific)
MFTDWRQLPTTTDALQCGGWVWRGLGVWDKTESARPNMGGLANQCEYIAWGTAGPRWDVETVNPVCPDGVIHARELDEDPELAALAELPGLFRRATVRNRSHIAEKPIEVMRWLCQLAPSGGVVVDPFMGSGTTLRAAVDMGRRAIGIEMDEPYCELAAKRLDQHALEFDPPAPPPVVEQPGLLPQGDGQP